MAIKEFPGKESIYVTGYPRSGNTFLARLLGNILNSPVTGFKNAVPLATEGLNRNGPYVVRQLHLKPIGGDDCGGGAVPNAYQFRYNCWRGEKIVHIIRDPRDVVVSAYYYWQRDSLGNALVAVGKGKHPLFTHGSWSKYVGEWLKSPVGAPAVKYEHLVKRPHGVIEQLLTHWGVPVDSDNLERAIAEESFQAKRKVVEKDGDSRPYGKEVQLRHMRHGVAGDWKGHFNDEQLERARGYFGEVARKVGYDI